MREGKLIAFEGIDNTGKTTIAEDLQVFLNNQGFDAVVAKELSTPVGELILSLFHSRKHFSPLLKTLLFAADRAIRYEDLIVPGIAQGKIVIVDRHYFSAIVYRAAEDFDIEYVRYVNKFFSKPDLTFLIDLDPKESVRRGEAVRGVRFYDRKFLERVRELYLQLAKQEGFIIIDGMRPIGAIEREVSRIVMQFLGGSTHGGLPY